MQNIWIKKLCEEYSIIPQNIWIKKTMYSIREEYSIISQNIWIKKTIIDYRVAKYLDKKNYVRNILLYLKIFG